MFHFQLYIYSESSDFTSNVILSKSTGQHVIIAKKLFSILSFFLQIFCVASNGEVCVAGTTIFLAKKNRNWFISQTGCLQSNSIQANS